MVFYFVHILSVHNGLFLCYFSAKKGESDMNDSRICEMLSSIIYTLANINDKLKDIELAIRRLDVLQNKEYGRFTTLSPEDYQE